MTWIDFLWTIATGACFMMAAIHLWIGLRVSPRKVYLLFSVTAFVAGLYSIFELRLIHASTPSEFLFRLQVQDLFSAGLLAPLMVFFIWIFFGTGRKWLLITSVVLVELCMIGNFGSASGLVYLEINSVTEVITFGGARFAVAEGVHNPWNFLNYAALMLMLLFVADASVQLWRQGDRDRAVVFGGAVTVFFFSGGLQSLLVDIGVLKMPYLFTFHWLLILLAMIRELSNDRLSIIRISRELRENQQRMNLAISAADIGLWEWDIPQDEIWLSRFGRKRLGLDENQTLSFHNYLQTLPPEDRERFRKTIIDALHNNKFLTIQFRALNSTGEVRWREILGQFERDSEGLPIYVRGVTLDITERKHAEQKLQRSEYLARLLLNTTSVMTHLIDQDGRIIDVNETMANALGKPRQELLDTNVFDHFPPDVARRRRKIFKAAAETRTTKKFQDSFTAGKVYEIAIYPCNETYEGKSQFVVYVHDITSFKELENELRLNETRLKNAQQIGHIGDWEVDVSTNELIWSDEMYRILEIDPEQAPISFEAYLARIHPEDRDAVRKQFYQGLQSHSRYAGVCRLLFPDGRVKHIYRNATPVFDTNGKISKMVGVVQDISTLKNAQDESMQLRLELAHINRFMTMNELSVSLAHEINQPLGAIVNYAGTVESLLAQDRLTDNDLRDFLKDIASEAKRAGQIIDKVRGIMQKQESDFKSLDINSLLDEVVAFYRNIFSLHLVSFSLEKDPNLEPGDGDRIRLQQVLMNLINNAIEAMEDQHKKVLLIRTCMEPSGNITVIIRDNGPGIREGYLEQIFKPFVTTKIDGIGLGLRLCKSIIEQHGGRIWAENNPDSGASFCFSLPAHHGQGPL